MRLGFALLVGAALTVYALGMVFDMAANVAAIQAGNRAALLQGVK